MISYMLPIERKDKILQFVESKNKMSIQELAAILEVSPNTVRSDLDVLAKEGFIIRVHGGVMAPNSPNLLSASELSIRHRKYLEEKRTIARLVLSCLSTEEDLSIFFDSSTTGLEVGRLLSTHTGRMTAITHFFNIGQILGRNPNISVMMCGGAWFSHENCTLGDSVVKDLNEYHADIAIIGCTGLHLVAGISNDNIETVPIKIKMSENADQTWLLCDHHKFDKRDLLKISNFDRISRVFTDREPSPEWKEFFKQEGILLHYPQEGQQLGF